MRKPDIKMEVWIWRAVSAVLAIVIVAMIICPHLPGSRKPVADEPGLTVAEFMKEHEVVEEPDTLSDGMIWMTDELSDRIFYIHERDGAVPAHVFDHKTNTVLEDSIEFARFSYTDERMLLFRRHGKYGYLSCRTGKAVIPEQFDEAFPFSEGRAAVVRGETLYFIDYKGRPVNDKRFHYDPLVDEYIYCGDLCVASNGNGKFGLIDKNGNWVASPKFDVIEPISSNLWQVSRKNEAGKMLKNIYNQKGKPISQKEFTDIYFSLDDDAYVCTLPDGSQLLVTESGKLSKRT